MPAILEPADFGRWLDPDLDDPARLQSLLRPAENEVLEFFEIDPAVNTAARDEPAVQRPARPPAPERLF